MISVCTGWLSELAVICRSFGCTVVEMVTGHPPWHKYEGVAAIFKIATEHPPDYRLPDTASDMLRHFLDSCFRLSVDERPSAAVLLQHKFVSVWTGIMLTPAQQFHTCWLNSHFPHEWGFVAPLSLRTWEQNFVLPDASQGVTLWISSFPHLLAFSLCGTTGTAIAVLQLSYRTTCINRHPS